jgi:hypothetical protein
MDSRRRFDSDGLGVKELDIEQHAHDTSYLNNRVVESLSWNDISVTVRERETKKPKKILDGIRGYVAAGERSSQHRIEDYC